MSSQNNPPKTFDQFLKDSLTASEYERLRSLISGDKYEPMSPHRLTKIKENPRIMSAAELLALSKLLGKAPVVLSEEYKCGYDAIEINTMETINKEFQAATA